MMEMITATVVGILCIVPGIFNMRGDLSTIRSYTVTDLAVQPMRHRKRPNRQKNDASF